MENSEEIARLCTRMSELWGAMDWYREHGYWPEYWATRRTWLAAGRLMSALYAQDQASAPTQDSLFGVTEFRPHDDAA